MAGFANDLTWAWAHSLWVCACLIVWYVLTLDHILNVSGVL